MKVTDKRNENRVELKDVMAGDVFTFDNGENFWFKTNMRGEFNGPSPREHSNSAYIVCARVNDGMLSCFHQQTRIFSHVAELIVS